jgi:hypothetical protein
MAAPAAASASDASNFYEDIPRTDFPTLFTDQEFEGAKQQRIISERSVQDRWDNRAELARPRKTDGLPESTIEQRFSHVAKHLVGMWGSEVCALYLKRLLIADREGRDGFPLEVIEDLLLLDQLNSMLFTSRQTSPRGWNV